MRRRSQMVYGMRYGCSRARSADTARDFAAKYIKIEILNDWLAAKSNNETADPHNGVRRGFRSGPAIDWPRCTAFRSVSFPVSRPAVQ